MSKETEILELLSNSQAFSNPLLDILNSTNNSISIVDSDALKNSIDDICDSIWPSNIPYPSEFTVTDKETLDSSKLSITGTIQRMIAHTNSLSGSVINADKNIIALIDLTLTAKDTTEQWDKSKNINTHPLYESASVLFLKTEIIENLTLNIMSLMESYNFLLNSSSAISYITNNIPIFSDQKDKIRFELNNINNKMLLINTYLTDILNHDNTGWDSIQRKVFNKLFSLKLSSYSSSNSEIKEYLKIVGTENFLKLF